MNAADADIPRNEVVKYARRKIVDRRHAALLLGCAVLISLRRLEIWLNGAEDKEGFHDWESYLCLISFSEQKGGFLQQAVEHLL